MHYIYMFELFESKDRTRGVCYVIQTRLIAEL
jgi:hypothetical protein